MAEFMIKVSTDALIHQSEEIKKSTEKIRQLFQTVGESVRRSSGYWEGEASNLHTTRFSSIKESCDEITRRLAEHPEDLLKMAGLYTESETKSVEDSNSLQNIVFS